MAAYLRETATFHILTPYPGTLTFRQMEAEGRILRVTRALPVLETVLTGFGRHPARRSSGPPPAACYDSSMPVRTLSA